jgi:hypothetical protein
METKNELIKQLNSYRKAKFYSQLIKVAFISFFIILAPFAIYDKWLNEEFSTVILLLAAESVFIVIAIVLFNNSKDFYSIKKSRIYCCIDNPENVAEIIVTSQKILFELNGMEDETIYIKPSTNRDKLLSNIKQVFGESKIVNNS